MSLSAPRSRCRTSQLLDYRVQEYRLPSRPSFKCNVLRESLSVDSQNIPCATLNRRGSWVLSVPEKVEAVWAVDECPARPFPRVLQGKSGQTHDFTLQYLHARLTQLPFPERTTSASSVHHICKFLFRILHMLYFHSPGQKYCIPRAAFLFPVGTHTWCSFRFPNQSFTCCREI